MQNLTEIIIIREEIQRLNDRWGDLVMLESLINNLVYVLARFQQNPPPDSTQKLLNRVSLAISELLNTLNKEIAWAKELPDTDTEKNEWFKKAKYQILEDINGL
jgi:hypothetical protein